MVEEDGEGDDEEDGEEGGEEGAVVRGHRDGVMAAYIVTRRDVGRLEKARVGMYVAVTKMRCIPHRTGCLSKSKCLCRRWRW